MKLITSLSALALVTVALTLTASTTKAAVIAGVTLEDFTGEFDVRLAVDSINGSGFNEVAGTHDTSSGNMWLELSASTTAVITYDLGANYDLSSLDIWNYNEAGFTNAGINDVDILVASTVGGSFTSIINTILTEAPGTNTDFRQTINLSGFSAADNTRLIRFEVNSSHGNNHVGLSEVRFDGVAVPEPSTLTLISLAGLSMLLRRRR